MIQFKFHIVWNNTYLRLQTAPYIGAVCTPHPSSSRMGVENNPMNISKFPCYKYFKCNLIYSLTILFNLLYQHLTSPTLTLTVQVPYIGVLTLGEIHISLIITYIVYASNIHNPLIKNIMTILEERKNKIIMPSN